MACGTLCTSTACKTCRTCKDQCEGFNFSNPDTTKSCKRSCEATDGLLYPTAESYLKTTAEYMTPEEQIADEKAKATVDSIKDAENTKLLKTVGIIGIILVVIIAGFLIIRRMK